MKITAVVELDLPDAMAENIVATAGMAFTAPSDRDAAILIAAFRQLPVVLREFLLAPEHEPIAYHTPTRLSTPQSQAQMLLSIHPGEPPCRVTCPSPSPPKSPKRARLPSTKPCKNSSSR